MFELHEDTQKLLDLFEAADYGDAFSYAQILEATGCDVGGKDRHRILTVNRRLERDSQKTLMNLRGVGYRVAYPGQFVDSMRTRSDRAKTQLVKAQHTGHATPRELLNDMEAKAHTDQLVFNSRVIQAFSALNHRFSKHEKRLEAIEKKVGIDPPEEVNGTAEEDH